MKKNTELGDQLLKGLYKTATPADKLILEEKYGKEFFTTNIMDIVDSYESACAHLGKDPVAELPFAKPTTNRQRYVNAAVMLDIISEALLDGNKLDWSNGNQKKWWPWFDNYRSGSGFRFFVSDFAWAVTYAGGGARLCLDTKEKSDYFGMKFLDIWNDFLNPNK